MRNELSIRNRQRVRTVDLRLLHRIARWLLQEHACPQPYQLGIHLVAAPEMTRLNTQFLSHNGSTDVITFDYADSEGRVSLPMNHVGSLPEINETSEKSLTRSSDILSPSEEEREGVRGLARRFRGAQRDLNRESLS